MALGAPKRTRGQPDERRPHKRPRIRKQVDYYSSSENEDDGGAPPARALEPKSILKRDSRKSQGISNNDAVEKEEDGASADELEKNTAMNAMAEVHEEMDSGSDTNGEDESDLDSENLPGSESEVGAASVTSSSASRTAKKRNDPEAFATSISKILGTKLSQPKRQDPILSRSKDTLTTTQQLADSKLENKARALIRAEKKQSLEKGRVRDVLALESDNVDTGALLEDEKRLKKTAQRGVVRLFNAVRAVQIKAEEARRQAKDEGLVGMQKRDEKVNEMSKQGFLDLISKGGSARVAT